MAIAYLPLNGKYAIQVLREFTQAHPLPWRRGFLHFGEVVRQRRLPQEFLNVGMETVKFTQRLQHAQQIIQPALEPWIMCSERAVVAHSILSKNFATSSCLPAFFGR